MIMTTGLGSPVGNIVCPVIKVCGNPETSERMGVNLDVDASSVIKGVQTLNDLSDPLSCLDYCFKIRPNLISYIFTS